MCLIITDKLENKLEWGTLEKEVSLSVMLVVGVFLSIFHADSRNFSELSAANVELRHFSEHFRKS